MNELIKALIQKTGSFTPQRMIKREKVLEYRCSRCGATPGEPCLRYNGVPRVMNHMERVALALGYPVDSLLPARGSNVRR